MRYQDRESWKKITAAYATTRGNNWRRINAANSTGGGFDNQGKFMRDIVSTTQAVELAFSKCIDAEKASATTLVIPNNSKLTRKKDFSQESTVLATSEHRVKTADRTA